MLVGEAPGADEDRELIPFVGQAGKFLDTLLRNAGLDRNDIYLTNVVKVRPPDNKLYRLKEIGTSVKEWIPSLLSELHNLKEKKVIVPLGDTALRALFPNLNVSNYRGSYLYHDLLKTWVIPTYHPSYLMQYAYKLHTLTIHDLKRASEIAKAGGHVPVRRTELIQPSLSEAIHWISQAARSDAFAWDLETFGDQISCLSLATSRDLGVSIPFKNGFKNYWSWDDEVKIWDAIGKLMSGTPIKIAHNGFRFDNEFIYRGFGNQPAPPHFDTLLAHGVCHPELKHSLDLLASIYTDVPYYKDDTKSDDPDVRKFDQARVDEGYFQTLWKYNAKDAYVTFECYERLAEELKALGLYNFFTGYEQPLRRALFDLSQTGIPVDSQTLNDMKAEYEGEISRAEGVISKHLGKPLNVKSPKQMSTFLYTDLGLPPQYIRDKKTGQRRLTTSEDAIDTLITKLEIKDPTLLNEPSQRFQEVDEVISGELGKATKAKLLREFLNLRGYHKICGTYLNETNIDPDGRLRTSYGLTETGRLSSKGKLGGKGMNLQNQPKSVRKLYRCPDGWEVFEADLAQAEARVVAYLSGCQALIDEFNRPGGDVFTLVGSWIFGKPQPDVTKAERQLCKATIHGTNYGMGVYTFAQHIKKPQAEAKIIQDSYFKAFPEVRLWQERTREDVCRTRVLRTPLGRYRKFLGRIPLNETFGHDTYKEALAHVPQSSVGDIENQGVLKLYHRAEGTPVELWCQVHDAIIGAYPLEWKDRVKSWILEAFSKEILIGGRVLRIPVEAQCGLSWGELSLWFKK